MSKAKIVKMPVPPKAAKLLTEKEHQLLKLMAKAVVHGFFEEKNLFFNQ